MKHTFLLFFLPVILLCSCNGGSEPVKQPVADTSKAVSVAGNADAVKTPVNTAAGDSFFYEPSVSILSGTILKKAVYGPPGYGEDPETDKKDSIYLIVLDKKIDVHAGSIDTTDDENYDVDEKNVDSVQLSFSYPLSFMKKYLRRHVRATGTLFHRDNAYHYTNVLLTVTNIQEDLSK